MPRLTLCFLLCAATALAAETTPAPLPPEEAVKAMRVPDGFRVTLVAAEPDVVQPISYCLDDRGRLFVAEALNYGQWQATGKDRIVILEDTDGDGRAESRKVFYEGLNYVTGIEVGFGGVWAMSPPNLYFIPDRDGDDRPDGEPEVVLDGFGYKESRHNLVNGFTWGPDGWLYAGHGRTSPSDVGPPGTPADERTHCDGGVIRIHPVTRDFENFADGTTNPWGVDFDDYGQCFVSNCVNPHLFHIIPGAHYEPWRNRPSSLYAYQRIDTIADHLHYAGKTSDTRTDETQALGGGHAHCGTLIYLGDSFPPAFRNTAFMCNVHGRRINNDRLQRRGSGYVATHAPDFAKAGDPWFMGVTLRTGPDGSVLISDWSDTGECHTYKPMRDTGRIYKISYGEPRHEEFDLAKLSDDELVKLQLHKNEWHVRHARRLLQERAAQKDWEGDAVHAALQEMLASERDAPQRLRALWTLHVTGGIDRVGLAELLEDDNEHLRAWAIQLLCEDKPADDAVRRFADLAQSDRSQVVRLHLASALQRLPLDDRWDVARGLVSHAEDAIDANLPLMAWYGIEPLAAEDPPRALQLAIKARIPLVRQFIARRVVDAELASKKPDLSAWVKSLLTSDSAAVQLDFLKGAREALQGRKQLAMPEGWSGVYGKLAASEDATVREHAIVLALTFGDPQALIDLRKVALSPQASDKERQSALEALVEHRAENLAALLQDLLQVKILRRTAIRGLAAIPDKATPELLRDLYADLSPEEKQDAIATLASRKEYALALLDALEKKEVPRADVSAFIARQLHALADEEISGRLRKVWGEVRDSSPQKQQQAAKLKALLTPAYLGRADVANGRLLFQKSCQQCHKLYGEGGTLGPDLTGANRNNLDYLLSNLLDPSAEIGQDYRLSVIVTTEGRTLTGLILERTPARLVVQTTTERIVLAADDVEEVNTSTISIMPEGQLDTLTKEQIRDLIGYLGSKRPTPTPGK